MHGRNCEECICDGDRAYKKSGRVFIGCFIAGEEIDCPFGRCVRSTETECREKDENEISAPRDRLWTKPVLPGSCIDESRNEPSNEVCNYFSEAYSYVPSREEPFYPLGKHCESLFHASVIVDVDLFRLGRD